jgi:hypothetical protein
MIATGFPPLASKMTGSAKPTISFRRRKALIGFAIARPSCTLSSAIEDREKHAASQIGASSAL